MDNKIKIEILPYDALEIVTFLREFDFSSPKVRSLKEAIDNFEEQLLDNISEDDLENARAQREVNILLNKRPSRID